MSNEIEIWSKSLKKLFTHNRLIGISIALIILLGLLMTMNYFFARYYPGGKYFQTQWIASRNYVIQGTSPYSDNSLNQIQVSSYGGLATAGEYEFRFSYPFFSLLIFLPFGLIKNYLVARAIWMTLLEVAIVIIYWLSLNLSNWRPNLRIGILLFLFIATYYHSIRAIVDGNLIIIVTFLLIAVLIAIRDHHDESAGVLLAFTFLNMQFILIPLLIILIYSISSRRIKIIGYFLGCLALLLGFSFLILPEWITGYFSQLALSITNNPMFSFGAILKTAWGPIGARISIFLTIITASLLIFEWIILKNKNFKTLIWFIFLAIVLSQWSGLPAEPSNFVLLYPGLFFSMAIIIERWKKKGESIVFAVCTVLYLVSWVLNFALHGKEQLYFEPGIYFIILPMAELLLLYWSRWWVRKPKLIDNTQSFIA